jgi:hypothetical protein
MDGAPARKVIGFMVYRWGKLGLAGWRLMLATFWLMAAILAVSLFIECFVLRGWDIGRAGVTIATAVLNFAVIRAALSAHKWVRPFWTNLLEIGEAGIRLRLQGEGDDRIAWPEILSIRHERRTVATNGFWPFPVRVDEYVVSTARGPLSFTSMDIPGAKRADRKIEHAIASEVRSRGIRA